jgi:hypothetical protein
MSIEPMRKHQDDSDIIIVMSSPDIDGGKTVQGTAVLQKTYEKDLLELSEGDTLTLKGKVSFTDISESVSLQDCELVGYKKNS